MSELSTLAPEEDTPAAPAASAGRPVRRRRGLPGGRAVIGAFLVTAAAVGIFGAYLSATAAPTTRYVVAARDLPIGARLAASDLELVAMELPDEQADRAISEPEAALVDGLDGLVVLGPLAAGDLVMASQVVDDGDADGAVTMSFALPADRALAGRIRKGEAIDVIATYPGAGGQAYTEVVIRGATVFDVVDAASSGISGQARTFLVQVADLGEAQRLAHALDVAEVVVARSGDEGAETPAATAPTEPDVAGTERYVLAGLARARADWFRAVGQWATAGAAPIEFVRCVSVPELRGRLTSGRPFSAVLLEADLAGVDRDLIALAREAGAAVIVVTGTPNRDWVALGASAVLPPTMAREQLLETLSSVAAQVQQATSTVDRGAGFDAVDRAGRVVAVTGSGGVGTSTVAIAAAQGLAVQGGRQVLLADLQRDAEQAMLHDTRVVVPGIQELVEAHRTGVPSVAQVREQTFAIEARGYSLLLGLRRSRQWVTLRPRALEAAMASLTRSFDLVVCDVAPDLEGEVEPGSIDVEERNLPARLAVGSAEVVLAVGEPSLKGLYSLVRVIADLVSFGTPATAIVPVLNRAPRSPKKRAELARALLELVTTEGGPRELPTPVFLPSRAVEEALRDGVALPKPLPETVAGAVTAALSRSTRTGGTTVAAEPVAVAPGSLGFASEEELPS